MIREFGDVENALKRIEDKVDAVSNRVDKAVDVSNNAVVVATKYDERISDVEKRILTVDKEQTKIVVEMEQMRKQMEKVEVNTACLPQLVNRIDNVLDGQTKIESTCKEHSDKFDKIDERIEEVKDRPANASLGLWKFIGGIVLTGIVGWIMTIVSMSVLKK